MFGDLGLSGAGWLVLGRFSTGGFFFSLSSTLGLAAVGAKTRHRARVNTTTRIGAGGGGGETAGGYETCVPPLSGFCSSVRVLLSCAGGFTRNSFKTAQNSKTKGWQ